MLAMETLIITPILILLPGHFLLSIPGLGETITGLGENYFTKITLFNSTKYFSSKSVLYSSSYSEVIAFALLLPLPEEQYTYYSGDSGVVALPYPLSC
jgi:hypothetical protein